MKVGIVIQGRLASTRLRDKILLPFYKDRSLIQILIERLKANKLGAPVILATTDNEYDDKLIEAVGDKVLIYRGSEFDVLDRFFMPLYLCNKL